MNVICCSLNPSDEATTVVETFIFLRRKNLCVNIIGAAQMLGKNNAGWPYPVSRFAPKLTTNNITPQNAETKVPELAAALIEQRTYNQAISDLRLGEAAAAAEQRADFAPLQQAVEQLGVVTGLAAVAPEALADSYAKAIKDAASRGGDVGAAIENVKNDLVAKIKSGEIEYNKVDGVLEKISKIAGAPVATTGDGVYKIDAASGKMIDIASGAPVADVRKLATGYRVTVPGKDAIVIPIAEFDKVFSTSGSWGAMKPDTKNKVNMLYAAINPAAAAPVEYDPLERAEKAYKRDLGPQKRSKVLADDVAATMFEQAFEFDTADMAVENTGPGLLKLSLKDNTGMLTTDFEARLSKNKKNVGVFDATGTMVAELPTGAFSAWMDAADIASGRAFPSGAEMQALRDRVVHSELRKKKGKTGARADYVAEIRKLYDAAGLDFDVTYAGEEINRALAGKTLTGEGKKATRTFGQETKDVSRKLFNEISRQLDKMEADGKISGAQRTKMIMRAAKRLGIKLQ